MRVFPLYSSLSTNKQLDVFRPSTGDSRKVILSTNIAETSVTISGVRHVIDSGMVKTRSVNLVQQTSINPLHSGLKRCRITGNPDQVIRI